MTWLTVLKLILTLASQLTSYLHDQKMMDAGEAKATLAGLRSAQDATQRAMAARDAVRDDPVSVRNDPNNRDGK